MDFPQYNGTRDQQNNISKGHGVPVNVFSCSVPGHIFCFEMIFLQCRRTSRNSNGSGRRHLTDKNNPFRD